MFLNNDLSMLLSREQNPHPDFGKEWEEEQKEFQQAADAIIRNPSEEIDADAMMARSFQYAGTDDYYRKLFTEGTDAEQMQALRNLEYVASMTLLPECVLIAGGVMVDKEDYGSWAKLLYTLHYVPLQKELCYCLTRHKDYTGLLNVLDFRRLTFPQTFLWALLDHWFEWLTHVGGHLLTYSDEKGFYDKNKKAQELKAEAAVLKAEWERELPEMVHEIMVSFSRFLNPGELLAWATKEPLRYDAASNPYSANYNHCLKLISEDLLRAVNLKAVPEEDLNLNMLLLMTGKAVADNDTDFGKYVYYKLLECLLNENFSNMEKKSELDEERQKIIARLVRLVFPDIDFKACINDVAARFQGWNLDYQQVYYEARREAYLVCSLFRIFEIEAFDSTTQLVFWETLVNLYVREYRRCENEYIMRDEFSVPFRVAIEVVEIIQNDECREYLHQMLLENVLSIVSLLTIFSERNMFLSRATVEHLLQRIDVEWPSAKLLMEIRGQKRQEARIEELIGQLKEVK